MDQAGPFSTSQESNRSWTSLHGANILSQSSQSLSQSTNSSFDHTPATSQDHDSGYPQQPHSKASLSDAPLYRPQTPHLIPLEHHQDINMGSACASEPSPTHGSKRTASGKVKNPTATDLPTSSSSESSIRINFPIDSSPSKASELKARLSYAMVKVHNGWESRNFNEIEHLASHATSPNSPRPPAQRRGSPRISLQGATERSQDLNAAIGYPNHPNSIHVPEPPRQVAGFSDPLELHPNGENYPQGPSKAFDARATRFTFNPNSAQRRQQRTNVAPKIGTHIPTPTSTRIHGVSTPTPAEQDAVDTLLFMSSPANSANFGRGRNGLSTANSSSQTSPTKSNFTKPGSRGSSGFGPVPASLPKSASISSDEDMTRASWVRGTGPAERLPRNPGWPGTGDQSFDQLMTEMREYDSKASDRKQTHGSAFTARDTRYKTPRNVGSSGVERA